MIKLKELRKQFKFTQEHVSKILNIDKSQISNIERGKSLANEEQIRKICKAMNSTSDYLLGLIDKNIQSDVGLKKINKK